MMFNKISVLFFRYKFILLNVLFVFLLLFLYVYNKSMPTVSVIVPVYKTEPYLRRCLDSILEQSYRNFEIICVNDGSPDNCLNILHQYAAKDNRVRVINQKNQGLSGARNSGLDIARGKYIYFVDSDDFIHKSTLQKAYETMINYDVDVVWFDWFCSKNVSDLFVDCYKNQSLNPYNSVACSYEPKSAMPLWINSACTKFYKKSAISDFRFKPRLYCEDMFFNLLVFYHIEKYARLKDELYFYIQYDNSIMSSEFSKYKADSYIYIINYLEKLYLKNKGICEDLFLKIMQMIKISILRDLRNDKTNMKEYLEQKLKHFSCSNNYLFANLMEL